MLETAASVDRAVRELRSELGLLRRELRTAEAALRRQLAAEARQTRTAVWTALALAVEAIVFAAALIVGLLR